MSKLKVTLYRNKWFISAGKSRLSRGFSTQELAEAELKRSRSLYDYWSKSVSVSVENATPEIRHISVS